MTEAIGSPAKDIGVMAGPVLVFGGPYSNLEATRALFEAAAEHQIPGDRMICTGDVVAYCAAPQETLEFIAASGIWAIQGNCEISLGAQLDDCGCGFDKGSTCDQLSARWYAFADANIGVDLRRWMAQLPGRIDFEIGGRRLAVVHGAPSEVAQFVFALDAGGAQGARD
jgi:predicted phosphodiesterase